MTAEEIVATLGMLPHPEGGFFVETYRDPDGGERGHSTAIYFLLRAGDRSHWHRVDAAEMWHHYAGAPLVISVSPDGRAEADHTLGPDLMAGERPQFVVPKGHWMAARSLGEWTLVGCTVAPAFRFEGFELAPPGWAPGEGEPRGEAT